uniref:DUF4116 domain-containing protein n=1 Tax=viral metagenome TaxID=1070528 RepID=A0A6C0JPA6_9ZZZZ
MISNILFLFIIKMLTLLPWIDKSKLVPYALCLNPQAMDYLMLNQELIKFEYLSYNCNAYNFLMKHKDWINTWNLALNTNKKVEGFIRILVNELTIDKTISGKSYLHLLPWDHICQNPIMINIINENPDKIHWKALCKNKAAVPILKRNFNRISWPEFCLNTSPEAIEIIKANPDKIDWISLSSNSAAIEYLEENMDKINHWGLSWNSAAIHIIEKHLSQVSWMGLSANPSAIHLLKQNPDKIDWLQLSTNPFIFEYDYQSLSIQRTGIILEELMMKTLHPTRIEYWLNNGMTIDDI